MECERARQCFCCGPDVYGQRYTHLGFEVLSIGDALDASRFFIEGNAREGEDGPVWRTMFCTLRRSYWPN
jgi:hypothetical protein